MIVFLWSASLGVVIYEMLGVSITTVGRRPATFMDELLIHGVGAAFTIIILHSVLLLILFVGRVVFQWWVIAILLLFPGTPVAVYSGWKIADYLWTLNRGGVSWEGFAPQVIGLALAWIVHIPIATWLSRYRFLIVRRDRNGNDNEGNETGTDPDLENDVDKR